LVRFSRGPGVDPCRRKVLILVLLGTNVAFLGCRQSSGERQYLWGSPSRSNLRRNDVDWGVEAARQPSARLRLHAANPWYILNHMVQYTRTGFDASFAALSDATRRGVLEQLGRADASITNLAERFHMTLTGMKKHVGVLEQAGLVSTEKVGRVRTCKLGVRRLEEEAAWIERYRQLWEARFDELDKVVEELRRKEKVDGRKKRE